MTGREQRKAQLKRMLDLLVISGRIKIINKGYDKILRLLDKSIKVSNKIDHERSKYASLRDSLDKMVEAYKDKYGVDLNS